MFAALFFGFCGSAEGDAGLAFGFVAGKARALEVVSMAGDVRAKFFVEVGIELRTMEDARDEFAEIGERVHRLLRAQSLHGINAGSAGCRKRGCEQRQGHHDQSANQAGKRVGSADVEQERCDEPRSEQRCKQTHRTAEKCELRAGNENQPGGAAIGTAGGGGGIR